MVATAEALREFPEWGVSVCNEDLLESPSRYNATWGRIFEVAETPLHVQQQVWKASIWETEKRLHSGSSGVCSNERERLVKTVRYADGKEFASQLGDAAQRLQCSAQERAERAKKSPSTLSTGH